MRPAKKASQGFMGLLTGRGFDELSHARIGFLLLLPLTFP